MRKILSVCVIAAAATVVFAQDPPQPPASAATKRYHAYRTTTTEPTYGLAKVKGLIRHIKKDQDENERLSDKVYNSLSFQEKFTYAMLHGEDFSQNCDMMPIFQDEEKKIFAYPAGAWDDESGWSERQLSFLKNNRGKIIGLLRETMRARGRAGSNIKRAVLELNLWELTPDLVAVYNRDHKDHDVLTVLMILMKENKYGPFLASPSFKKLYGDNASYQSFLNANTANQKLEISRAMAFYNSKK